MSAAMITLYVLAGAVLVTALGLAIYATLEVRKKKTVSGAAPSTVVNNNVTFVDPWEGLRLTGQDQHTPFAGNTNTLVEIASSPTTTLWLQTQTIRRTANPVTSTSVWSAVPKDAGYTFFAVTYSPLLSAFLALGRSATQDLVLRSDDQGASWYVVSEFKLNTLKDIAANATLILTCAGTALFRSGDAVTWDVLDVASRNFTVLTYVDIWERFYAFSDTGHAYYSADAINWTNEAIAGVVLASPRYDATSDTLAIAGTGGFVSYKHGKGTAWTDISALVQTYATANMTSINIDDTRLVISDGSDGLVNITNRGAQQSDVTYHNYAALTSAATSSTNYVVAQATNGFLVGSGWTSITPVMSTQNFTHVAFFSGSTFIAAGASGLIHKSTDNGATWSDISSGSATPNSIYTDGTHTVILSSAGHALNSTNNTTFTDLVLTGVASNALHRLVRNTAGDVFMICGAAGKLWRAGSIAGTWSAIASGDTETWTQMATNGTSIWVIASTTKLRFSSDAGLTWTEVHASKYRYGTISYLHFDGTRFLLTLSSQNQLASLDGMTWTHYSRLPASATIIGKAFDGSVITARNYGLLVQRGIGSHTWDSYSFAETAPVNATRIASEVWLNLTSDGHRTSTDGRNWVKPTTRNLVTATAVVLSDQVVYADASATHSTFFSSADGLTVPQRVGSIPDQVVQLYRWQDQGLIALSTNRLHFSSDAGVTWNVKAVAPWDTTFAVAATSGLAAVAGTNIGEILYSNSDLTSFTAVTLAASAIQSLIFAVDRFYAIDIQGNIFSSSDATGSSWTALAQVDRRNIGSFATDGQGTLALLTTNSGNVANIFISTNQGITWTLKSERHMTTSTGQMGYHNNQWTLLSGAVLHSSPDLVNWSALALSDMGAFSFFNAKYQLFTRGGDMTVLSV